MVNIIGKKIKPIEEDNVLVKRGKDVYAFPRKIEAFKTDSKINPQNYALIQEGDKAVCAISMTQGYNGDKQEDTIIRVLKAGLKVPRASRFIRQLLNVNQAVQEKGVLYDAFGNLIKGDRLEKYVHTLNDNHWVWSPESFRAGKGYLGLDVVTISGSDERSNPVYKKEPLEECLEEDCYADLNSANSQGFLTKKARTQKYEPGKTIYFNYPRQDFAVWFRASPSLASFSCNEIRQLSAGGLGVFACVEEVKNKN